MSEYVFTYGKNSKVYDWTRFVEAGIVPTGLPKPSGLEPKPLNPLQRAAMNDRQIAEHELRIRDFATWRASERIRKQIEADRRAKAKNKAGAKVKPKASMPLADGADPEAPGTNVKKGKKGKKKEVWGVYRADGSKHTEGELDIGRQALMALVKTTNEFSKNANTVLLAAQKENNVELEKKIKDAVSELNRNGGLDIAKRYEKDPSKLSSRDLQTLVALMEEADDVIDSVQEFQLSTEHLNTVIQKFDLGDKLQMAERKKFAALLGMTEKGIGNSLSGLAKNSPKELTKSTGGASTVLATMLGAALGPFGDAAAMLVNSDWVSDKIEEGGGKVVDFVKGKVGAARAAGKLGKKGKPSADTTGDPSVQGTPEAVASTPGTTTEPPVAEGTVLTGAETNKGLHIKPMGIPAPFLDAKMVEKLAKEIGDEVERGMRTLYKQLGGKVFDSDDLKLYLTTMQKEIPKEMEKLAAEFPSHAEFLRDLGTSMQDALGGETRDVLGRLDTLIESAMKGQQSEAERELELNRAEKAEQKRHDELIDTLESQGKLERKLLKKELDDVERKTGQGGGLMSTLLTALGLGGGVAGAGIGARLLKKVPGGAWLSKKLAKIPGIGKHFTTEVAEDAAKSAAKPLAKSGTMKALGRMLAKVPKKGKLGIAVAAAGALLGLSDEASADEADTVGTPVTPAAPSATSASEADTVGTGTQAAAYGAAGIADAALQTAGRKAATSAGGGLIGGTLLKAGAKRIPIIGGAVDGYMTYRNTGSVAQGVGAGVGNALGGLGGAVAGTAVLPGVGTVAGEVAGSIGGSMAGQELGRQLEEDPKQFAKTMTQYGTPMGLAFLAMGKLTKAIGITSKNVDETAKSVDKTSDAVGDSSKNVEKSTKDLEKTAKATEGWLARISRWNPFSGGGKEKEEAPAPVVQDMTQKDATKQARHDAIKKYLDDGGTNPQAFLKAYDAQLANKTTTADGKAEFGTGSTNDMVWNDGSSTTVIKNGLAPGAVTKGKMSSKGAFAFGGGVDEHVSEAANKYGIPEDVLRGFVKMEGGWKGQQSPTGAIGVGQFTQGTWNDLAKTKEGAEIGMKPIDKSNFRGANDPRRDQRINTLATALLAKKNSAKLQASGIEATGENLYMAHNMGAGFVKAVHGKGKFSEDTRRNMDVNGGRGMSSTQFMDYQKGRFNKAYSQANSGHSWYSSGSAEQVGSVAVAAEMPETKGRVETTLASNPKENASAQTWAAPMKYEAKTSGGARLGLPETLRPAQEQPPTTSVTDATANANRLNRSQPTISDANFMPDDIGLMLVASGMV